MIQFYILAHIFLKMGWFNHQLARYCCCCCCCFFFFCACCRPPRKSLMVQQHQKVGRGWKRRNRLPRKIREKEKPKMTKKRMRSDDLSSRNLWGQISVGFLADFFLT